MKKLLMTLTTTLLLGTQAAQASPHNLSGVKIACEGFLPNFHIVIGKELADDTIFEANYEAQVQAPRLALETIAKAWQHSTRTQAGTAIEIPLGHGVQLKLLDLSYDYWEKKLGLSGKVWNETTGKATPLACVYL